jgi:predicted DsbA family dithiol-disulfide isomerase
MLGALPYLIRRWVRAGKLQIHFRSIETDTQKGGGWFEFKEQQSAALAAGKQDKLWNFIDVFYRNQGPEFTRYVDKAFLRQIAREAGLDRERWEEEWKPDEWVAQLELDEVLAKAERLPGTPSFLIGPTGGLGRPLRHFELEEPGVFEEAIRELL